MGAGASSFLTAVMEAGRQQGLAQGQVVQLPAPVGSGAYDTDIPRVSNPDVCPPGQSDYTLDELKKTYQEHLNELYSKNAPTAFLDDSVAAESDTNRIPQEALRKVAATKIKRANEKKEFLNADGKSNIAKVYLRVDDQVMTDTELFKKLHVEYCYYEQRYTYALKKFLDLATSRNPSDNPQAKAMLDITVTLNRRVNFMIEFMNFLAIDRASETNSNVSAINNLNKDILEKQTRLKIVFEKIKTMGAVADTQKEMIRYTKEKNNNVTNQISVWTAANVLALATVFYVYRSS